MFIQKKKNILYFLYKNGQIGVKNYLYCYKYLNCLVNSTIII